MPSNTYDLIVIGDDFAGLVGATLCASRGMRVLLCKPTDTISSYKLGPYKLPVAALPFAGLTSPAVRRVVDELHFDHLLKRKLRQHDPAFQLIGPDARVDVDADEVHLAKELERELPDNTDAAERCEAAAEIARHLDPVLGQEVAFPPAKFWERREVSRNMTRISDEANKWYESVEDDHVIRAFIELPAALASRSNPLALSAEARARCFSMWRQGTPRIVGDWQTLRDVFEEKFTTHSGEIRRASIAELTFGWSKATGIRLESGEELGASHVMAAMPIADLLPLAEKKKQKRLAQCVEKVNPAGYRYTLNLVIDEAGIPEGMADTVLVVGDVEAPLINDNAFAIYVDEPDDEARAVVTVEAVCAAPEPGRAIEDLFADLRVGLREKLAEVMPFFADHLLLAHSPHESVPAEIADGDLQLKHPVSPEPVWDSELDAYLGVTGVPYSVGIKNLTVASSQVLTGLGLEGDFAAGWCAANLACTALGKKRDPVKSDLFAS